METLPIPTVKHRLNELVDLVSTTHRTVTITKDGSPAAVLIGTEEWESLQETLFWLSQPGIRESVEQAARTSRRAERTRKSSFDSSSTASLSWR